MARVSVITGYYNRAPVLERTVLSILSQTYADLELVVFDDASQDRTAERLAELSRAVNDPRFRYVVHKKNIGFVAGLRRAIEATTGEYVAIQGSGDVSMPTRIEEQVALLDARPEVGVVGSWYVNVVESTGVSRLRQPDADPLGFDDLLKSNTFSHGEVMIRRSAYERAGGYRDAFVNCQDLDLWLRISQFARLATVPSILYHRYVQFDGVSYSPAKVALHGRYRLLARRIATADEPESMRLLAELERHGPLALVPADDSELQAIVRGAALRSAVWGAADDATEMARDLLTSRWWRNLVLVFAWGTRGWHGAPLRLAVRRAFSVTRSTAQVGPVQQP